MHGPNRRILLAPSSPRAVQALDARTREICAELTQGGDHDSRVAAYAYGRYAARDRPSWRVTADALWPLIAPQFAKASVWVSTK